MGRVRALFLVSLTLFALPNPYVSFTLAQQQDGCHFASTTSRHDNIPRKENLSLLASLSREQGNLSPNPLGRLPTFHWTELDQMPVPKPINGTFMVGLSRICPWSPSLESHKGQMDNWAKSAFYQEKGRKKEGWVLSKQPSESAVETLVFTNSEDSITTCFILSRQQYSVYSAEFSIRFLCETSFFSDLVLQSCSFFPEQRPQWKSYYKNTRVLSKDRTI